MDKRLIFSYDGRIVYTSSWFGGKRMAWPKVIEVGGIKVPVDSWEEVREAIETFGRDITVSQGESRDENGQRRTQPSHISGLSPTDRTLLEQFIQAGPRGVLTKEIGQALGKRGKGVRPALEGWSRRIGLVTEQGATAFESVKRFDGRGFAMIDHYIRAASGMLGR
jgi:hypothetical protein